jgi:hypothetical protein
MAANGSRRRRDTLQGGGRHSCADLLGRGEEPRRRISICMSEPDERVVVTGSRHRGRPLRRNLPRQCKRGPYSIDVDRLARLEHDRVKIPYER